MKSFLLIFLALMWACIAAEDTAVPVRNLRGEGTPRKIIRRKNRAEREREREEQRRDDRRERISDTKLKEVCCDLHDYGRRYGHYTFEVPKANQRWFHRWCKLGPCKDEDELPRGANTKIKSYCRVFGGKTPTTMWAPAFFGTTWLRDHDATGGECTQRNQGDAIDVVYSKDPDTRTRTGGDDSDLYCVETYNTGSADRRKSPHTVEVIYPGFDVSDFRDEIERAVYNDDGFDGRCFAEEDDLPTFHPRHYCVKFDDIGGNNNREWCTVDTDSHFRDFFEVNFEDFRTGVCPSNLFSGDDCHLTFDFYFE